MIINCKKVKFNNIWITDIGGRTGGRGIYISEGNNIILWGVSKDHEIEFEAERFFGNCSEKEFKRLTEDLEDITHEFLTEAEEKEFSERTKVFAENLSDDFLKDLGLDDYQIKKVRESNTVSIWDIKTITPGMKFRLMTLRKASESTILKAMDEKHFTRFINGDVSRLLIHTDDHQTAIIDERVGSNMLIRGETGSGKTTILIYKAVYAAIQNTDKDYILFTYNIALANLITESVEDLTGEKIKNLTVYGFLEWAKVILDLMDIKYNIIYKEIYEILGSCYSEQDKKALSIEKPKDMNYFIETEIDEIILDHGIDEEQDYLIFTRHGRKKRLGKDQRKIVWEIYKKFRKHLKEKEFITYKILPELIYNEIIKSDFGFRKDGIFVDEVQDMSPMNLKAITALKKDRDSYAVFAGDYKQSIYRKTFRWDDIGLPFKGQNVKILKKNYRNSKEILKAAHYMLEGFVKDTEKPENSGRSEHEVVFEFYKDKERIEKLKGIIEHFRNFENILYSDIAIFAPKKTDSLLKDLLDAGVPAEILKNSNSPSKENKVKVSTLHSSKGLEFRIVIILGVQGQLLKYFKKNASKEEIEEEMSNKAKLLYVGMTRAYNYLTFLLHSNSKSNPILERLAEGIGKTENVEK